MTPGFHEEEIVGKAAMKYQREDLVISTKAIFRGDAANPAVVEVVSVADLERGSPVTPTIPTDTRPAGYRPRPISRFTLPSTMGDASVCLTETAQ